MMSMMEDNENDYDRLCERLREGDPSLTEVVVSKNVDAVLVGALANKNCTVKMVSLVNCAGFGNEVAAAVASMTAMTKIYLGNAGLTTVGARKLANSINFRQLQLIDLQDNQKLGPRGIQPLAEKFSIAKELVEIHLSNCHLGHFGAKALGSSSLPACLRVLDLSCNGIGNDGAWKLAPALKGLSSLQSLLLSKNQISDDGSSAIGRQLPSNLKILDMSDNDVADVGAEVISQAVVDSRLEKVVLANNKIGDLGAMAFGHRMAQSSCLVELDLDGNEIGDEGATALAKGLAPRRCSDESVCKTSSLLILCLRDNSIGDEGAGAFVEHLDQNRVLVTLDISGNDGISSDRRHILEMLFKHRKPRRPFENEINAPPTFSVRTSNDRDMILSEGRRLLQQSDKNSDPVEISLNYLEICSDNFNAQGIVNYGAFGELFKGSDSDKSFMIRRVTLGETDDVGEARTRALRELVVSGAHF
jgi:Ran GTPase-activating protein (RanGAP) involved in mRNA processing and transport